MTLALDFANKLERMVPAFPEHIDIELTNACNLRCAICPRKDMTRPVGHMDFQLFRRIADEISDYGLNSSWLHLFGEPLLYSRLVEAIQYLKAKGNIRDLGISTNAVLLTRDASRDLIRSGLDRVILSLDGASKGTYEAVRTNAQFEVVVGNVETFLQLRRELAGTGPRVWLQIIDMEETAEEIEEFRRRWSPYLQGDDVLLVKPFDTFAGQTEDRGRSRNGDSSTFYEFVPCEFLWRNLAIFWDGRVTSCCFDVDGRLTVGNLEGTSLTEIWLGQLLQNLRWVHERGLFERLPLCGQCSKTKEFGPDARMRAEDWPGSTEVIRVGDPPSDNLFGAGWYPVDQTDPPVRWTKRKASVFLKLPSSADAIQVLCSSGFPCIDGTPTALKLLIDDEVRGQFALSDNNWHVLQCRLSGRERTEVVKLDIVVAETWCPHTVTGSGDMRELGIAVREIRVR